MISKTRFAGSTIVWAYSETVDNVSETKVTILNIALENLFIGKKFRIAWVSQNHNATNYLKLVTSLLCSDFYVVLFFPKFKNSLVFKRGLGKLLSFGFGYGALLQSFI